MDPLGSNVTNLQEVIFFLLPGFLTILLFYYQIPDRRKSDLTVTILSVIASVIITYIAVIIYTGVNTVFKQSFPTSGIWFDLAKIFLSLVSSIALARFVESDLFGIINKKIFQVGMYPFGRLWNSFFKMDSSAVLKVFLQDGTAYIGRLRRSSYDPNDDVQELELSDPYSFDRGTGNVVRIDETDRVLILGNAILSIEKIKEKEAKKLYSLI